MSEQAEGQEGPQWQREEGDGITFVGRIAYNDIYHWQLPNGRWCIVRRYGNGEDSRDTKFLDVSGFDQQCVDMFRERGLVPASDAERLALAQAENERLRGLLGRAWPLVRSGLESTDETDEDENGLLLEINAVLKGGKDG